MEWFVGFLDAEGLFGVYLYSNGRAKLSFRISLHKDDLAVLESIKKELNVGTIYREINSVVYSITKGEDLENILFYVLDTFPLNSTKYMDYLIFKQVYYMNKDRLYRTDKGLNKIKTLLLQLNNRITDFTYPSTHTIRITLDWLIGFIEGDGGFYANVSKWGVKNWFRGFSNGSRREINGCDRSLPGGSFNIQRRN